MAAHNYVSSDAGKLYSEFVSPTKSLCYVDNQWFLSTITRNSLLCNAREQINSHYCSLSHVRISPVIDFLALQVNACELGSQTSYLLQYAHKLP